MATTTNFGWETPDDTDLVKDGALAMRTLGNAIDTSLVDLKGGTTGQVLSKTSNTDMDFTWVTSDDANAIQNAIVDAKGDLITATAADTPARLAIGTDGQVLTADSTTATGLKWAAAASGTTYAGCRVFNTTDPTISNNTTTTLSFNSESFDTDGYHSTTTNTSRITIPSGKAGKYFINGKVEWYSNSSGYRSIYIVKNGTNFMSGCNVSAQSIAFDQLISMTIDLAVGDYVELHVYHNSGGSLSIYGGSNYTHFEANYLGA